MSKTFDLFVESCRNWHHETRAIALTETGPSTFSVAIFDRIDPVSGPLFTGTFTVGEVQASLERLPSAPLFMPQDVAERYPRNALEEYLPRLEGRPQKPAGRFERGVRALAHLVR